MEVPSKGLRKGAWTADEDNLLRNCIDQFGEGKWHQVPIRAGLNRCRKSCRLRWLNYLKPNIKRGKFGSDEVDLLLRLHKLLGNRWSLIAGRLPGRTANDVKNYWNTHLSKKQDSSTKTKTRKIRDTTSNCVIGPTAKVDVIKPRPRSFINDCSRLDSLTEVNFNPHSAACDGLNDDNNNNNDNNVNKNVCEDEVVNKESMWWESLLEEEDGVEVDGTLTEKMTEKSCFMKSTSASFDVDQLWSLFDGESEDL